MIQQIISDINSIIRSLEKKKDSTKLIAEKSPQEPKSREEIELHYFNPIQQKKKNAENETKEINKKLEKLRSEISLIHEKLRSSCFRKDRFRKISAQKRAAFRDLLSIRNQKLLSEKSIQADLTRILFDIASGSLRERIDAEVTSQRQDHINAIMRINNAKKELRNIESSLTALMLLKSAIVNELSRFESITSLVELTQECISDIEMCLANEDFASAKIHSERFMIRCAPTSDDYNKFCSISEEIHRSWREPALIGLHANSSIFNNIVSKSVSLSVGQINPPIDVTRGGKRAFDSYVSALIDPRSVQPEMAVVLYWLFSAAERECYRDLPVHAIEEDITNAFISRVSQCAEQKGAELFKLLGYGERFPLHLSTVITERRTTEPAIGADMGYILHVRLEDGFERTWGVLLQAKPDDENNPLMANVWRESNQRGAGHNGQMIALTRHDKLGYYLFYNRNLANGPGMTVVSAMSIKNEILGRTPHAADQVENLRESDCQVSTVKNAYEVASFLAFEVFKESPSVGVRFESIRQAITLMASPIQSHVMLGEMTYKLAKRIVVQTIGRGIDKNMLNLLEELGYKSPNSPRPTSINIQGPR